MHGYRPVGLKAYGGATDVAQGWVCPADEPVWADECLAKFELHDGLRLGDVVQIRVCVCMCVDMCIAMWYGHVCVRV